MFCDTHTHLLDDRFEGTRQDLIDRFEEDGIDFIIECSTDATDIGFSVRLAEANRRVYAAVGIHPHSANEYTPQVEEEIKRFAQSSKVVAIGEVGLDFHYDFSPRDVQERVFAAQINLARELDLPIIVHSREASEATFNLLCGAGVRGELHCYSGSAEMAIRYVESGFYIAFGGSVTFKNARKVVEAAQAVPMERLLIETDCPYLAPEPNRGKTNQPAYVRHVAEKLSEIKGIPVSEIARITKDNAKRLFAITEE
ncbi:MAG: TatD family hydrolase [Eubacteriales bacterium]